MLQFAPKRAPVNAAAPKPAPGTPPPAREKGCPKHVLVTVTRIAAYLGVDIRIVHGYIRRGALRAYFKDGDKRKKVYADEAYMAIKRTAVKREDSPLNAVRPGVLLSWNKGDGRREVGLVGKGATESGMVEVQRSSNKPFLALLPELEKQIVARQVFLENPTNIVKLVVEYLKITDATNDMLEHLERALDRAKDAQSQQQPAEQAESRFIGSSATSTVTPPGKPLPQLTKAPRK